MTSPTDKALRALDPTRELPDTQVTRGDAMLERTLATEPVHARPKRRRIGRLLARGVGIVAAASVAALAGAIVLSSTGGGDAFANYTPKPAELTAAERDALHEVCYPQLEWWAESDARDAERFNAERERSDDPRAKLTPPFPPGFDPTDAIIALAERRGDVVVLAYAGRTQDFKAPCMAVMPTGSTTPRHAMIDGLTGGSYPKDVPPADQYWGGGASQGPEPGTGGLLDLRTPTMYSLIQGSVGDNVAAMTVHTREVGDVEATIHQGYYTAWWPGEAYAWPADVPKTSGRDRHEETFTITLTLKDGTVIDDAPSYLPR